jgi:hypothetical protein
MGLRTFLSLLLVGSTTFLCAVDHERQYQSELRPLLTTYCLDCHSKDAAEGGIPLDRDQSAVAILKHRKDWLKALRQLQGKVMPPPDGPKMDDATRQRMERLIEELANAADCLANPNPGKVVMRRLNRVEYRNTIRDLTGVDYTPAIGFPADDVGYGFDNIGDVLTLPPLLLEKYFKAAEQISRVAIVRPPPPETYEKSWGSSQMNAKEGGHASGGKFVLSSVGTVVLEDKIPFPANYTLTISAGGDQAGGEPCRLVVLVGDKQAGFINVPNEDPVDYTVKFRLAAGPRKIGLRFVNDYYKKGEGGKSDEDRNLHLHFVKLEGEKKSSTKLDATKLPASHKRLIFVQPSPQLDEDAATRQIVGRLGSRAFRRPLAKEETERYVALAKSVREDERSFEESIQVVLQAILVSPNFLYKVETIKVESAKSGYVPLNDYELASRLSYFLWSSMPDDALLRDAVNGRLGEPTVLREHTLRMLKDRRSASFVESFAGQWLQLRSLERINPDPRLFPKFTDSIRAHMKRETLTFVQGILQEDLPVTALLRGRFTYLNEELANYYGIPGVKGTEFRPVSLEGTPRGGLLTQGAILTVTSNPSRTSPVKRGKWILDNLLGTPPPPAPPDVPELEKGKLTGTLREKMEQHRVNPACASCHKLMDPLGFALENFDGIGRWRELDQGTKIDPSGELPDGTKFQGAQQLWEILSRQREDQFVRCLAEKLLIYALGRGLEYYDKCAVDDLIRQAQAKDLKFTALIVGVVLSEPFRKQGVREL